MKAARVVRNIAAFLALGVVVALWLESEPARAASPCGSPGQRACCWLETSFGACRSGAHEEKGCSGDCKCGGVSLVSAIGHCVADKPVSECGDPGERACCVGEASFGACKPGSHEVKGCTGNCRCGKGSLLSSSGRCVKTSECGDPGERACCVGETSFGACKPGSHEESGCSGNCTCKGGLAKAIGHCVETSECGDVGERACCAGETKFGACKPGSVEAPGCQGNCRCGGVSLASSIGHCVPLTPCGGEGERACTIAEKMPSCDPGLFEMPFCGGNCYG
jgi:hypothetical protein